MKKISSNLFFLLVFLPSIYGVRAQNQAYEKYPSHVYILKKSGHLVLTGNQVYTKKEVISRADPSLINQAIEEQLSPQYADDLNRQLRENMEKKYRNVDMLEFVHAQTPYLPYCIAHPFGMSQDALDELDLPHIDFLADYQIDRSDALQMFLDRVKTIPLERERENGLLPREMNTTMRAFFLLLFEHYWLEAKSIVELDLDLHDFMSDRYKNEAGEWVPQNGVEIEFEGFCTDMHKQDYLIFDESDEDYHMKFYKHFGQKYFLRITVITCLFNLPDMSKIEKDVFVKKMKSDVNWKKIKILSFFKFLMTPTKFVNVSEYMKRQKRIYWQIGQEVV
ncbi:MAG: hypothetical protein R3A45_00860 [Bdellovibrionota bacterium]